MRRIRILLAGMPRMLLDMITDIVGPHAEMMVAGKMKDTADLRRAVKKTRADVVILKESATGPPQDHQELLYSRPQLRVLSITTDGRQFFLHKLRPDRIALGEVSPESLVQAIRSSAQEVVMVDLVRRKLLGGAAAGAGGLAAASVLSKARAQGFGNPNRPPTGAVNATNPASLTDPGPQSPAIADQFPMAVSPPATSTNDLPQFWASFNNAVKRIQNGGWARQVTQYDFQISETITGVNMRLTSGGIRELHWHEFAEWAYVTYGTCRITVLDPGGQAYAADVNEGELWIFPPGFPHSLQGVGQDGTEFIIAFNDGRASEYSTLLVTDFLAHTPPDILAQNFQVPVESFSRIPLYNRYIFQGDLPGPLAADQAAMASPQGPPRNPFSFSLKGIRDQPFFRQGPGGTVQIADSRNFRANTFIASALVTLVPGGLRELHWHPNADEWQYYIKGKALAGVFTAGGKAQTTNFNPGDIGYIKRNNGHYVKNTGNTELQFLEVFKSPEFHDVSLSDWLTHTPPAMVAATFNMDPAVIARWPKDKPLTLPIYKP
jgi:oxalate decarboxylase